jgi:hypothetical protein
VLDGSGQEVDRIAGFLEAKKFIKRIQLTLAGTI